MGLLASLRLGNLSVAALRLPESEAIEQRLGEPSSSQRTPKPVSQVLCCGLYARHRVEVLMVELVQNRFVHDGRHIGKIHDHAIVRFSWGLLDWSTKRDLESIRMPM